MDLILAGPVILGSPAWLVSPDVGQVFLAISLVSEAEVAVSVAQAEEISADQGAVGFRLSALEDKAPRSLRAIELCMHDATVLFCTVEWFCHHWSKRVGWSEVNHVFQRSTEGRKQVFCPPQR